MFVLSSRFEGFPLILLEAMSKGMGIVSFDCPTGPADIVDDHRNGLLVPHEDVEGLARAIREMVEDEELRRRTAAAAIETAQQYTIEAIGPLWLELLEGLSRESRRALTRASPVVIRFLIADAYSVGGTIRTTFATAAQLARDHEVEVVSVYRFVQRPALELDPRVRLTCLTDLRPAERGGSPEPACAIRPVG